MNELQSYGQANEQVTSFIKTLIKIILSEHIKHKVTQDEVHKFLLSHRTTPHASTKAAPTDVMFKKKIRNDFTRKQP